MEPDTKLDRMPRLLLVDDGRDNLEILQAFLESRGYSIETALDGTLALEAISKSSFEAVLLDEMMPGLSGCEVARRIRAQGNLVAILFVTARGGLADRIMMLSAGGDNCITKPINLKDLVAAVAELISKDPDDRYRSRMELLVEAQQEEIDRQRSRLEVWEKRMQDLEQGGSGKRVGGPDLFAEQAVIGSVAHALKGELTNIGTGLQVLGAVGGSADFSSLLVPIRRSIEFSHLLIEDLVTFANVGLEGKATSVRTAVDSAVNLMRPRLPEGIHLRNQDVAADLFVMGSFEQLTSMIVELIQNATKAIDDSGEIWVSVEETEGSAIIRIADTGRGMSSELLSQIGKAPVPSNKGRGIGLYLINRQLHAYGGKLLSQSSSEGTEVSLIIPKQADGPRPT